MNKFYKVKWNCAKSCWVVCSEISKNISCSASKILSATSICLSTIGVASAATCIDSSCEIGHYSPEKNKDKVGQAIADSTESHIILSGDARNITKGMPSIVTRQAKDEIPAVDGQQNLTVGAKTSAVTTPDSITNSKNTVLTYDSKNISTSNWGIASSSCL